VRDDGRGTVDKGDQPIPGESFVQRFHRRKLEARKKEAAEGATATDRQAPVPMIAEAPADTEAPPPADLTDADMPPLASLTVDSDYSGFLSPKVSETLRRAALRKLFHSAELNVLDELDDYAEDFTTFAALGDVITSDMRHRLEVEARKQAEALKQALLEEEDTPAQGPPVDTASTAAAENEAIISDGEPPPRETENT